jgi:hypothetical protein
MRLADPGSAWPDTACYLLIAAVCPCSVRLTGSGPGQPAQPPTAPYSPRPQPTVSSAAASFGLARGPCRSRPRRDALFAGVAGGDRFLRTPSAAPASMPARRAPRSFGASSGGRGRHRSTPFSPAAPGQHQLFRFLVIGVSPRRCCMRGGWILPSPAPWLSHLLFDGAVLGTWRRSIAVAHAMLRQPKGSVPKLDQFL